MSARSSRTATATPSRPRNPDRACASAAASRRCAEYCGTRSEAASPGGLFSFLDEVLHAPWQMLSTDAAARRWKARSCAPWSWKRLARPSSCASGNCRGLHLVKSWSRSQPAASAAPTSMWSTANCPIPSFRSYRATKSWGAWRAIGEGVTGFAFGERIGVPWLGYTCGTCEFCGSNRENLCDRPLFTGYTRDGGYATHAIADARYCFPLPGHGEDADLAPLLCAGLIGWRSYRMAREGDETGRARPLWLRGRRAYPRPGRGMAGVPRPRVHSQRRQRRAGVCQIAWRGMGRRLRPDAAGTARRRHHLRAGRRTGAVGARGRQEGRPRRLRRHSHVGYPELSLSPALGGAPPRLGRQSHPR